MRILIQRVRHATVQIDGQPDATIGVGLLLLVGVEDADTQTDVDWLAHKVLHLRIFADAAGLMNASLLDIGGELLVVSQFTLFASTKKGNRPSFLGAAKPPQAIPIYENFVASLQQLSPTTTIKTGVFGADMQITLQNDGPVTIWIDSHHRE
jgi:D-aminoacyl-tRNA deacylase